MFNLRPSSVGGFSDCMHRWYGVHMLGVRSWSGYKAVRGTGVHKASEVMWQESIKAGQKTFSLDTAKDAAAQSVKDSFNSDTYEVKLFDFETQDGAIDDAVAGAIVYAEEIVPEVSIPVSVETYLKSNITDKISLSGTFDALGDDGTIRDIKTSSRKPTPSNFIDQMAIYNRLAEVNGLKPNFKYSIEAIVFMKSGIKSHILTGDVDMETTQRKIADMVSRIQWVETNPLDAQIAFPANSKSYLCSDKYCPMYDSCYLINNVPV